MRVRSLLGLALAASALALAAPTGAQAANQTLSVTTQGSGTGTLTSSPAGIECGSECSASFAEGTVVTLTATPGPHSALPTWTGCGVVFLAEGKCRVTMSAARSVTATFPLASYPLTVSKPGEGDGTVTSSPAAISCGSTCVASFTYGQSVVLAAVSDSLSLAVQWSGCDSVKKGECTVAITGPRSVTATFARKPQFVEYPLSIEKLGNGQGTVTSAPAGIDCGAICQARFFTGSHLTFIATADPGSAFDHFAGCTTIASGICETTIKAAKLVKAIFKLSGTRTLSVSRSGTGQGKVVSKAAGIECPSACSAEVAAGKTVSLTATAQGGSSFAGFTGACQGAARTCKVTMSEARQVTATFLPPPPSPPPAPAQCTVPRLTGKSLRAARLALAAHHCSLGRVRRPRKANAAGPLVIRSSSPATGAVLAAGAKVSVALGPKSKRRG